MLKEIFNFIVSIRINFKDRYRPFYRKIQALSIYEKTLGRAKIARTAILGERKLIKLAPFSHIKDYVIIKTWDNPVVIGRYTQINPFCVIYGGSGVFIGNDCMIAPHCMLASGNHDYKQLEKPMRFAGSFTKGPIVIEDDVWIAANCTIADGVHIGKGAVIGANSLVIRDVAPYDIVGGVPAKILGNRKTVAKGDKN